MTVRVAVVDANVLYSIELTDLFLTLATHRLVRVHWSRTILEEVRRNLARRPDLSAAAIDYRIDRMNVALPDAIQGPPPEDLIDSMPVNAKDRHVLALAVHIEADSIVTAMQSAPSGVLRMSVATDFGVSLLSPVLDEFLMEFPDISVNMVLKNRYVELISEGFDMSIRVGEMEDSSLRARKITETSQRLIAAPRYFQAHGRPERIDDLNDHRLLHYSNQASANVWKITAPSGEVRQVRGTGWLTVNDGQSLLNAAVKGLGIAYLPSFLYHDALAQGLVEDVIPDLPQTTLGIYAVYPPGRFTQPKVRAFIDFLVERFADKGPDLW